MTYIFIAQVCSDLPVATCCRVMKVSTSGFYAWQANPVSEKETADAFLTNTIVDIHRMSRRSYGSPRVHAELRLGQNTCCSRKRVERLMKEAGISGIYRRRDRGCTRRDPAAEPADDLVNREFDPAVPDRLWVMDVTEHPTEEGKLYLAVVIDAFSRRVVGWSIAGHIRSELVVDALQMAIWRRNGREAGTVMHTDHGSQIHLLGLRQTASRGRHPRLDGLGRRCPRQRHGRELLRHLAARAVGPPPLAEPRRARLGHL